MSQRLIISKKIRKPVEETCYDCIVSNKKKSIKSIKKEWLCYSESNGRMQFTGGWKVFIYDHKLYLAILPKLHKVMKSVNRDFDTDVSLYFDKEMLERGY